MSNGKSDEIDNEAQFELEDYDSDDERRPDSNIFKMGTDGHESFSSETLQLLDKLKGPGGPSHNGLNEDGEVRIFYCSRTHSQLIQFSHELRRVEFPPSIPSTDEIQGNPLDQEGLPHLEEGLKHITLGSRKTLCVNQKVKALESATAINERCLDLQTKGTPADQKCPYLPGKDNTVLQAQFRDHALAKVRDIEDLGKIGQKMELCPYYGSRSVVPHSEIIGLPYPLLLQRSAREALDISLKDHVIIIDEAHNLVDAISNIYSASVSLSQLRLALQQLTVYARKYQTRLKGKNRVYVTQTIRLVQSIISHLQYLLDNPAKEGAIQSSDLTQGKNVDQINPHKLSKYLNESKIARKVDGYTEYCTNSTSARRQLRLQGQEQGESRQHQPVIFQVQSFLIPLMNPSAEGKLFFEKSADGNILLKYNLLDATTHFREIVEDARAVILAGGTMSPVSVFLSSATFLEKYIICWNSILKPAAPRWMITETTYFLTYLQTG